MNENMQGKEMEVQKQFEGKPGLSIASMVCGIVIDSDEEYFCV